MIATERPTRDFLAWTATLLMTALAAAIRLTDLRRIPNVVFDETYYLKDGWSLWTLGYEGTWLENQDEAFAAGDVSGLTDAASFVVHPPVGKWLIGAGMELFGQDNPFGWRVAAAIAGVLGVFFICRLAWQLFNSLPVTLMSGLFLATDGMHVVMSRTALLDVFLSTFVVAAFLAVTRDQQNVTLRVARGEADSWRRPWLAVAGVFLGFACATKWSGIYVVAVLGLFVVLREAAARRGTGEKHWFAVSVFPGALSAFIYLVVVPAVVYMASWTGWMLRLAAWGHEAGHTSFGGRLADLWRYHQQIWRFHTGLTTDHTYQSNPAGWLLQIRPTSFWFANLEGGQVSAVLALGNPLLWWMSALALPFLVWFAFARRSWPAALVLCGFAALYLPWFLYLDRTVFTFYTVALAPFVALTAAWFIGWSTGLAAGSFIDLPPVNTKSGFWLRFWLHGAAVVAAAAIVGSAIYFAPLATGYPIMHDSWSARMWLPSWI